MLMLANLLLSESLLSDFPNKKVLFRKLSFCHIWVSGTYYIESGLSFKRIICVMEKDVNGRFDTITTTTSRVYRILDILFKFL